MKSVEHTWIVANSVSAITISWVEGHRNIQLRMDDFDGPIAKAAMCLDFKQAYDLFDAIGNAMENIK